MVAVRRHFYARTIKKLYIPDHDLIVSRSYSRQIWKKLKYIPAVDAIVSPGSIPVAFLPGKVPLVTISDATHRLLFGSYPAYRNLSQLTRQHGEQIELNSCNRATALVFSSRWAAESAVRDYGVKSTKVHVVPFGANLEIPAARATVEQAIESRDRLRMRLLFIGVEWERKGGPAAVEVARHLNRIGIRTRLTVMGCVPKLENCDESFVTVRGFIAKNVEGHEEIRRELSGSHFLIVPSIADCTPVVYSEASAFGLPVIARNVGGVSSVVRNGQNGRLFGPNDSPETIANWAAALFQDFSTYRKLALSSIAEYETNLNWAVAGQKLKAILTNVITHE